MVTSLILFATKKLLSFTLLPTPQSADTDDKYYTYVRADVLCLYVSWIIHYGDEVSNF